MRCRFLLALLAAGALSACVSDVADTSPGEDDAGVLELRTTHKDSTYSDAVRIIVEPGDKGAALLAAIEGARTSIHMTMYLLSSPKVVSALIAQHEAGLDVKVVLNKSFTGMSSSNAAVYDELKNAGVNVRWAPSKFQYTHEKSVILDGKTAWIMTMNASTSALTANREYLAVDTDAADVHQAEAIFAGDYAGDPLASTSGKLLASPLDMRAGLIALIQSATKTIDLESEELSDSAVVNALVAAHAAGIKVRVVIASTTLTTAQQAARTKLKQAGIKGVETSKPYIHAKAIVVDGATSGAKAYVGSANFTSVSLDRNRELGLVTANAVEIAKVAAALSSDFSAGTAF